MIFRTPVRCSNQWATERLVASYNKSFTRFIGAFDFWTLNTTQVYTFQCTFQNWCIVLRQLWLHNDCKSRWLRKGFRTEFPHGKLLKMYAMYQGESECWPGNWSMSGTRLKKGPDWALSRNSPLRNIPPNDIPSYHSLSTHKTGMAPHHSTESCDQETAWLTGKDSDSRSDT